MKLEIKKSLSSGIFKVDLSFKNFEVFEEGLMEDFGVPELTIPVSEWTADVTVGADGKYTFADITKDARDKVCDIEITKEIKTKIDSSFKASFEVKVIDIDQDTLVAPLDSVVKMAEAKCALFVEIIKQEAGSKMDNLRKMRTSFEASINNPETIRI